MNARGRITGEDLLMSAARINKWNFNMVECPYLNCSLLGKENCAYLPGGKSDIMHRKTGGLLICRE